MTTVRLMSWLLRFDKAIAISKRRGTATKAWFASENGILVECVRVLSHGMRMGLWTTMKDEGCLLLLYIRKARWEASESR